MKLKDGFILSEIADSWVAVPVGKRSHDFHGVVRLNDTGLFIWKALEEGLAPKQIEEKLMTEYKDVNAVLAEKAVATVVEELRTAGILEA